MLHSLTHSLDQDLPSAYYVPGPVLKSCIFASSPQDRINLTKLNNLAKDEEAEAERHEEPCPKGRT